jgi:CheY-like chemotaxis protein
LKKDVVILIVEDDEGHATLIQKNLRRGGVRNEIRVFPSGEEVLAFLFSDGGGESKRAAIPYLMLLDIRMPGIDGVEVLRRVKKDEGLCRMPVIMVTTTDDPVEVERCHSLGCSNYVTKPIDYQRFTEAIRTLGQFLQVVEVPQLGSRR